MTTQQINPLDVGVVGTQPKDKLQVIDLDGYMDHADAVATGKGEQSDRRLMMITSYDGEHFSSGAVGEKFNSLAEFLTALPDLREENWVVVVLISRE
jgi:hypothetical protein